MPSVKDFSRTKPSQSQKTHFWGSTEHHVLVQHPYIHLDRSCLLMQTRLQQNGCTVPVKVDSVLFFFLPSTTILPKQRAFCMRYPLSFSLSFKVFAAMGLFQHKGNNFLRSGLDSVLEIVFDFGRNKPQSETEMLRYRNDLWVKTKPMQSVAGKPSHLYRQFAGSDRHISSWGI